MGTFSAKLLPLLVLAMLLSAVVAGPSTGANRHGGPRHLSEEEHYSDGHEHNTQYDHEAFLGKEEAKKFNELSKEEARKRLGKIVDIKIDKDSDGSVTEKELEDWIRHVSRRYVLADAESRFGHYDKDNDGFITPDEHTTAVFGSIEDPDAIYDRHRQLTYSQAKERYERRFKVADENGDGKLNIEEYADFLHPTEISRMKDVYVSERMEEMDKNKDGKISLDEYIKDIWSGEGPKPDWLDTEKEHFSKYRDRDEDGYLSKEEVSFMVAPPKYDPANAEAKHLIQEADTDKDKSLSKEEILSHQDLFVGSRATNYGNYHDEF